jgi:hypothetical protein
MHFVFLPRRGALATLTLAALAAGVAACGGSGSNPLGNPPTVENPANASGENLSFVYFQKCINPIFLAQLQIRQGGSVSTNTCASSGCHDNATGTGGALRIVPTAAEVNVDDPAMTPEAIRATDMYKNYYSSRGSVLVGAPLQSRLLVKPLVHEVLHGGGLIFESPEDPNAKRIAYWITHPVAQGQNEFGSAASSAMFTPPDPATGACNTQ